MNFHFPVFNKKRKHLLRVFKEPKILGGVFLKTRNTVLSFFYILILFFTFIPNTFAQQVDLAISPPLLETIIKPGKSIMIAYRLQNFGDPTILMAKVLPIEPKDNLGNINIRSEFEGPIRFSLDNADREMEKPFVLKTGDSIQLLLRIRVPEGAPNGDYYYTFLAEAQPPPTMEGLGTARTKASIGSNILITVTDSGTVDVKGRVAFFDIVPRLKFNFFGGLVRLVDSTDKIPVILIVQNLGKNVFKPEGEITLQGNFGEKATYDIVPENVLAESQRLITALPAGRQSTPSAQMNCTGQACLAPTSLILSGFFVGNYRLNTNIDFGENSPRIFASTSFIAIPIKFIIALLIATAVGTFIVKRVRNDD